MVDWNGLFKWSMEHQDGTRPTEFKMMAAEDRKWLEEAMKQYTFNDVDRLVSYCPSNLPQAYVYARLVGFHRGGIAVAKWVKNGIEYSIREVFATKQDLKGELPCPSL